MDWEIRDVIVHTEGDVLPQVTDFVLPSTLGKTSLSKGTTLRLKPPPAASMDYACKTNLKFTNQAQN